ncbi:MAG: bifunctional phosphopantothenoylcysteine decarboxylase/phosphopantothenate--cysteine ligase CoaBC [Corynebacterium sp.]|nr:bifunctional phosphopantothenoylcysteine decarboxylase/phosphopantothenate--cysteine ligase CoaBC [Corynebacterium sp.]
MRILIGISGGIAAYKVCNVVRLLKEQGHEVQVCATENALRFVGSATLEALSGKPLANSVFSGVDKVAHVSTGRNADLVIIAPATADLLFKVAHGAGSDLLSTACLVATCPIILAPAMHTEMWTKPAVMDNVATMRARGITVLDPAHGRLTGADEGTGRLLEPDQITAFGQLIAEGYTLPRDLEGKHVVITAGGTVEDIDPVRFISNRSSGKQGFALAEVASQRGARVTLICGEVDRRLSKPANTDIVNVRSATQMNEAVVSTMRSKTVDMLIMAAAVADYHPESRSLTKLKKNGADGLSIPLAQNPDILAGVCANRADYAHKETGKEPLIVGFAAETGDDNHSVLDYAKMKLEKKGCDLLMVNQIGSSKSGVQAISEVFGSNVNSGWILSQKGGEPLRLNEGSKMAIASQILDAAVAYRD